MVSPSVHGKVSGKVVEETSKEVIIMIKYGIETRLRGLNIKGIMDNSKTTKTVGSIVTKLAHVVNADKALNTPKGPLRGGCHSYLKFVIYIFIIIIFGRRHSSVMFYF